MILRDYVSQFLVKARTPFVAYATIRIPTPTACLITIPLVNVIHKVTFWTKVKFAQEAGATKGLAALSMLTDNVRMDPSATSRAPTKHTGTGFVFTFLTQ